MFGNPNMLRQIQAKLLKTQEELANETIEATAGGGAVTIVINGHQKVQSVKIAPEAVDPEDIGLLEDLIIAAMNEAVTKSHELAAKRLGAITGGLRIPGLI
ncbi:MAG: YbaB/EbfC family nucleoid-associated protein [Chloroflexi bacterium]|nr:YbaB/EbfC family nucleoid-associated protein [Chloroflexota bacterium]MCL5076161.1 YbaB/EbfC family nucleoid-associated protein [Chloroflexota bacterium]